jgi:hypothetical protein
VAIGDEAGCGGSLQRPNSIAIGTQAGKYSLNDGAIAIGHRACTTGSSVNSIVIGTGACFYTVFGNNNIAIGSNAGYVAQGSSIGIGEWAGGNYQSNYSIAMGYYAGYDYQKMHAIALGHQSGQFSQGTFSISIGYYAGNNSQGRNAIAIGSYAGLVSQGTNAIAIGQYAGATTSPQFQSANSIVINASGATLPGENAAFYVSPIRTGLTDSSNVLMYDPSTCEIRYSNTGSKTFVIEHPIEKEKYLVHACLEGPESGIYYKGEGKITNNEYCEIKLPDYVARIGFNFTIQLTPIYSGKKIDQLYSSRVKNNSFFVYGENTEFFWLVHATRENIVVEPNKKDVNVKGQGPYRWI